jgi:hypothetical protein
MGSSKRSFTLSAVTSVCYGVLEQALYIERSGHLHNSLGQPALSGKWHNGKTRCLWLFGTLVSNYILVASSQHWTDWAWAGHEMLAPIIKETP